ncbi:zinc-dependent alcohol dehydrogenase family protein [uncultured Desulfuromonas sp.]|uniref:zinc-dependent alcohol dehydrogenase family protein n=1 Tax=uncultured Desulfuromonas sp. TaxID=181013 RepID=UPI002AAA9C85|nr:zinc-dependent alcohol dehydrogenase family protein [uncultured Desulfuromonas sp.]
MKAIVFEHLGHAEEVLELRDMDSPTPEAHQLLIRVSKRPIHPADLMFIAGRYRVTPQFPQVAGFDGVGTIAAIGSDVTGFNIAERVAFRSPGSWAEYAVAPATKVYPVPDTITDEIACQFPLNPLTAWGLLDSCALRPGDRLLITAGNSVVARLLTVIALSQGVEPFLLIRENNGSHVVKSSDQRILATGATVQQALQGLPSDLKFQGIVDAVGGPSTLALIEVIAPGGHLITYGLLDDAPITLKSSIVLFKNLRWYGFGVDDWLNRMSSEQLDQAKQALWSLLGNTPELLPVIGSFRLDQWPTAIEAWQQNKQPGKILLCG